MAIAGRRIGFERSRWRKRHPARIRHARPRMTRRIRTRTVCRSITPDTRAHVVANHVHVRAADRALREAWIRWRAVRANV